MAKTRQEKMKAAALAAVNLFLLDEAAANHRSSLPPAHISVTQHASGARQSQWKHFGRQQIFHSRSHWQHGR